MTQEEKSKKLLQAEERVRQAKAQLAKVKQGERNKIRKAQDRHKYMMGGVVLKYFPQAYEFSELEMNRIIGCAFSLKGVQNMINVVVKERTSTVTETENEYHVYEPYDNDDNENEVIYNAGSRD